ncbi:MAG TPA: hypothetical protein VMS11_14395 [Solirubrobacterales bacterium]|nr:hypothetical protein [Solirubrobacterales bacterium]
MRRRWEWKPGRCAMPGGIGGPGGLGGGPGGDSRNGSTEAIEAVTASMCTEVTANELETSTGTLYQCGA